MYTTKRNTKNTPAPSKKRKLILLCGLAAVVVACISLAILEYTNTTYIFHDRPVTHETQPNTPGRTANPNTKGEAASPNTDGTATDPDKGTANPGNVNLLTPSGNFVSNHRPKDNRADQQAVCVTTPGASCEIIFTNGSTTRSLPAQTTDRGGATYWTWSPVSANLTAGSWKVQAKATLHDQTKTASDATNLEIN
jgi:hypothetical protein